MRLWPRKPRSTPTRTPPAGRDLEEMSALLKTVASRIAGELSVPRLTRDEARLLVEVATMFQPDTEGRRVAEQLLTDEVKRIAAKMSPPATATAPDPATNAAASRADATASRRQPVRPGDRFNSVGSLEVIRKMPSAGASCRVHYLVAHHDKVFMVSPSKGTKASCYVGPDDLADPSAYAPCDENGGPLPGWTPPAV